MTSLDILAVFMLLKAGGKQDDQTRAFDVLEIRQTTIDWSENKVVAFGLGEGKIEPDVNFTMIGKYIISHMIYA